MTHAYRAGRPLGHNPVDKAVPLNDEFSRLHTLNKRIQRVQWWVLALSNFCFFGSLISMKLDAYVASLHHERKGLEAEIKAKFQRIDKGVPGIFKGLAITRPISNSVSPSSKSQDEMIGAVNRDFERGFYIDIDGRPIENVNDLRHLSISINMLDYCYQFGAAASWSLLQPELWSITESLNSRGINAPINKVERQSNQYSFVDTENHKVKVVAIYKVFNNEKQLDVVFKATTVFSQTEMTETTTFEPYFGE